MKKLGKFWAIVLGALSFPATITHAEDRDFMYDFLVGNYVVIGKQPDSNVTYEGQVKLTNSNGTLQVVRTVDSRNTLGTASVEKTSSGQTMLLRASFSQDDNIFEATYLINTDLDNHARLTGYVYLKNGQTKRVGLETLFADFGQLERK